MPANGPVLAIAEDQVNPNLLFAGTEFGLFFSIDGGQKWVQLKGGLPTTAVRDLSIQKRENDLVVGTFGRGIYSISTTGLSAGVIVGSLSIETSVMRGAAGTVAVPLVNISKTTAFGWRLNAYDAWLSVIQPNGTLNSRVSTQVPVRIAAAALQRRQL